MLKRVDQIKYDAHESALSRIRQSVFEHSFSKSKNLTNHLNNPDIGMQPQEKGFESANEGGQRQALMSEQEPEALEQDGEARAAPALNKNQGHVRPQAQLVQAQV